MGAFWPDGNLDKMKQEDNRYVITLTKNYQNKYKKSLLNYIKHLRLAVIYLLDVHFHKKLLLTH